MSKRGLPAVLVLSCFGVGPLACSPSSTKVQDPSSTQDPDFQDGGEAGTGGDGDFGSGDDGGGDESGGSTGDAGGDSGGSGVPTLPAVNLGCPAEGLQLPIYDPVLGPSDPEDLESYRLVMDRESLGIADDVSGALVVELIEHDLPWIPPRLQGELDASPFELGEHAITFYPGFSQGTYRFSVTFHRDDGEFSEPAYCSVTWRHESAFFVEVQGPPGSIPGPPLHLLVDGAELFNPLWDATWCNDRVPGPDPESLRDDIYSGARSHRISWSHAGFSSAPYGLSVDAVVHLGESAPLEDESAGLPYETSVRIFFDGELGFEDRRRLIHGDIWEVARVDFGPVPGDAPSLLVYDRPFGTSWIEDCEDH